MNDQLAGSLRAFVPALVAYLVGKGYISASAAADVSALIVAGGAVAWSIYANQRSSKVASVAAMPGTIVSQDGKTITMVEGALATAAKDAATSASGK